ncbi:MAG: hypothetical protein IKK81_01225 [Prevotella sp.]|nr:hypothetical protein [Prevotella sp.]
MFSYQQNFFKKTQQVTKELFYSLVRAPYTAELIDAVRNCCLSADDMEKSLRAAAAAENLSDDVIKQHENTIKEMRQSAANYKKKLPAFVFQATFDETKSAKGRLGRWRKQSAVRLNGLCVMDIDHVSNPVEIFQAWGMAPSHPPRGEESAPKCNVSPSGDDRGASPILLVYITPSGHGLKVVFKADPKHGNLIDNQRWMASRLGVEIDESCKDASRMSFICKEEDILFINDEIFTYENNEFAEKYNNVYRSGNSQSVADIPVRTGGNAHGSAGETGKPAAETAEIILQPDGGTEGLLYLGTPYSKIVNCWLGGKQPEQGTRHLKSLILADQLRYICDNNAKLIKEIMLRVPFVKAIIDERGENLDQTIASAMGYKMYKTIPKQMRTALAEAGVNGFGSDGEQQEKNELKAELPLEQWGKDIEALFSDFPCLKDVCQGLSPKQYPAALFVSAAFLGTLMTRCTYRFYHRPDEERRLNYCVIVIGDPASGKSFATRLYKLLAAPIRANDNVGYDAINRYKRERQERTTSSKAQKGEALKKPEVVIRDHPARTSNAQFIQDMIGAVETVNGQKMHLHMLTFDSELDNATLTQRGGSWIDKSSMELKAFHNEEDGQAYSNLDSVSGTFNVYWNYIYTGTPLSLQRKVTERNFGSGLATRLACIPLPPSGFQMMELSKQRKVDYVSDGNLKQWAFKLDGVSGELPLWPLVEHCWQWTNDRMQIAAYNQDKADELLLKRVAYYGIGIATPFIMMRHWDEWKERQTLTIDDTDRRLCTLALNIQYQCQLHFFGEFAELYFDNMEKQQPQKRHYNKYEQAYKLLPDVFTREDMMKVFGLTYSAASSAISRFKLNGVIEKVDKNNYKKIKKTL